MSDQKPKLDSLFQAASEIESPFERLAFLDRSCGDDHELRKQVEMLLQSDAQAGSFLNTPPVELDATIFTDQKGLDVAASLQAGLAQAFRDEQAIVLGSGSHSVLRMLGQTLDKIPQVSLRDSSAEGPDPVVRPQSSEMPNRNSDSRYQLQGEIARGGMGVILKGRDTDLGRDLAIKVLLDSHKSKPEVVQRFIEEAQIGGQLQHPGIAPIYELGQFDDKRPFFAMKLVKGEMLSKLLADRADASVERSKYIGIFEQICQTMGYAHSRGVIHRDLKPANIMVGAFGEVQVMDWGLAKVLHVGGVADEQKQLVKQQGQSVVQTMRSLGSSAPGTFGTIGTQTQVGSVMGTPAYMPPEQALGEIDHMDERADVFGLGAILCEILTGKPPYVADDGMEVFRLASRGKLEACFQRLAVCGADADLIALAKHCLELEPNDRPRDAGVLATRVAQYLESVESKLRKTELAKVDAQVRAEELRRRNKLTFISSLAVGASLLCGMGLSAWQAVRAKNAQKHAVAAFDELRATAPAFAEQARSLVAKEQFDEAIKKLDYAIKLRPKAAEFFVAKGDLLQCQLKLGEAASVYREALQVHPGLERAETSFKICEELLAAKPNSDGKLTRESLAKLHLAMLQQQRSAAELLPIARLLGEEKKLIVEYWLERLKDFPISAEKPLAQRLTIRDDGRLALDLSGTQVIDLSPLIGAPLAAIDVSRSKELTDLSPLRGMELLKLDVSETNVSDLSPLREMQTLSELNVAGSKVSDLSPLSELKLSILNFQQCAVSDLRPIRKMPLELVHLAWTRVADISPLIGMHIKTIDLSMAPVVDFTPLSKLPLEKCLLQVNRITDLAVLRGLPLKELTLIGCVEARNYAAIAEIKTLELLLLPADFRSLPEEDLAAIASLRTHPTLRQLGADVMKGMSYLATGSKDLFWQDWDREQNFVPALTAKGIKYALNKLPSGAYGLTVIDQPLSDLAILKNAPLRELVLYPCPVSDLTPIHDMKLEVLAVSSELLSDLSPLRGMPLKRLYLRGSKIVDLSPLKELSLQELYLDGCPNATDISLISEISTLEKLTVPSKAENIDVLRKLNKLQMLAFHRGGNSMLPASSVQEFWKNHEWISRLQEPGYKIKTLKREDDGTWEVDLSDAKIVDLQILAGAPIKGLWLGGTNVSDLNPLRGMSLHRLYLYNTKITDLSPLEGMPLKNLHISGTKVTDISVVRGLPLTTLRLHNCMELIDVSPLADCKTLTNLTLPPNVQNFEFLRTLPKLERIGFIDDPKNQYRPDKSAAEFWKDIDEKN